MKVFPDILGQLTNLGGATPDFIMGWINIYEYKGVDIWVL